MEKEVIPSTKRRPPRDAVKTSGACKDKCKLHKGKQRDPESVYCKTCGIFIVVSFIEPRKGGGYSCKCCNQRIRLTSKRYSGLK